MYSTIGLKIYGRKLKIHVIPQGEHRDAEENKPKETPMDWESQHANGGKGAEGMGADGPKNLFHGLKIMGLKIIGGGILS